jgi:hypothetical protein
MQHSKMGQLIKAATLSLLMLMMTSGLAGWQVMSPEAAGSTPHGLGGGAVPGSGLDQPDPPTPTAPPAPPLPVPPGTG